MGTLGFAFYGGFIATALGTTYYVRRERPSVSYFDAIAAGLHLAGRSSARPARRCSSWIS